MLPLFVLAGCARPAPLPAPRADPDLRVTLATQPTLPRSMDGTRFLVTLRDGGGRPVSGAAARLTLRMPTMEMPDTPLTTQAQAPGVYAGTGRFTMPGAWRVTVTATRGTDTTVQSFSIRVR